MSARIDHAHSAAVLVLSVDQYREEVRPLVLAEAQVHATLALVEQQRTANHIAYVHVLEVQYAAGGVGAEFDHATLPASLDRHGIALDRIREGLGL